MRKTIVSMALVTGLAVTGCSKDEATKPTEPNKAQAPAAQQPAAQPAAPADIPAPPDVAAPPADAVKTASGLASKVIAPGTGDEHPSAEDTVKVHYTGWKTDGKMFDSSVKRGQPAMFQLKGVIPGWTEGVQLMVKGEKRRFWIPENLAYKGQTEPKGTLVFDIELLDIVKAPKPIPAPTDVAAPPKDAQPLKVKLDEKTTATLSSKVLQKGTGKDHPAETDRVTVNYTGWTTDGKMFDSSVARGTPATFPLNGVIQGWTKGVAQMVEGEKRRLWIPQELAYKGQRPPMGMLVFDVELLKIEKVAPPAGAAAPAPGAKPATPATPAAKPETKPATPAADAGKK